MAAFNFEAQIGSSEMNYFRLLQRFIPRNYWRTEVLKHRVIELAQYKVLSGPFSGMAYVEESVGSVHIPKLLGTYEIELHTIVEELISLAPRTILNIGAAEGYYGIGFALRLPSARIVLWESSYAGRNLITQLAQNNLVNEDRISIRGLCTISELRDALSSSSDNEPLIVIDIEGGEALLLDPEIIPQLRECTVLVELHERVVEGIEDLVEKRFSATHLIQRISARARTKSDWPEEAADIISGSLVGASVSLMNEGRPYGMAWFFMKPK